VAAQEKLDLTEDRMDAWNGKRIVVMGLGHFGGGIAVSRWFAQQGAKVLVTDKETPEKLAGALAELSDLKLEYRLGEHKTEDFTTADLVVASPAVKRDNPFLLAAKNAGIPVTTEIILFLERCNAKILAVTGTKGKSTSTAMLGKIVAKRHTTHVGGNIGKSLLFDLPHIQPSDFVVLELSSYMLELLAQTPFAPHVALITMIAPDHLDRHGTFENYLQAKQAIVRKQTPHDFAVVNEENEFSLSFGQHTQAKVIRYGVAGSKPLTLKIPGKHNQLNAQGALAAAKCVGCTWEDAQDALKDFKGLPHRLELVHEQNGVQWYNDSIATIPQAAVAALDAFKPGTVLQIVGGSDKEIPFDDMASELAQRAKAILTIGKTGPKIAALARINSPKAAILECQTLENAVNQAKSLAQPGDTVLLSTGCASYDQFTNFEERGEQFAQFARNYKTSF
jgi:UDP-N-acetylmuramoylalanine--D-glutamate ligase